MVDCCCTPPPLNLDPHRGNAVAYSRILWGVLAINAVMFLVEIGAGLAAGSASFQADALDFLGGAGNYAISLIVVGMALRYRASAALAKGATMGLFGLWVIGAAIWHAVHGTLPSAFTMGAVGLAALAANAASFGLLWAYRGGDATMRSACVLDLSPQRCCGQSRRVACCPWRIRHRHRMAGRDRGGDHGRTGVAGCHHCCPAIAEGTASAGYCASRVGAPTSFRPVSIAMTPSVRRLTGFSRTNSSQRGGSPNILRITLSVFASKHRPWLSKIRCGCHEWTFLIAASAFCRWKS